jgi:hypothetical protein
LLASPALIKASPASLAESAHATAGKTIPAQIAATRILFEKMVFFIVPRPQLFINKYQW